MVKDAGNLGRFFREQLGQLRLRWLTADGLQADFAQVRTYCMFIGYPRSGHSLVGCLLDAHPNIVIAQELDALAFVARGCNRERLFRLLLERSRRFAQSGSHWFDHSYAVPGQWQGRHDGLHVIGDKKGGRSTRHLTREPRLLELLRQTVGVPVKLLHVIRNPFDNITTRHQKSRTGTNSLEQMVDLHFQDCATIQRLRGSFSAEDFLDVRHEALIAEPKDHLRRICEFLGVSAGEEYLEACASIVFRDPRRSRFDVAWSPQLVQRVEGLCGQYEHLSGYDFQH